MATPALCNITSPQHRSNSHIIAHYAAIATPTPALAATTAPARLPQQQQQPHCISPHRISSHHTANATRLNPKPRLGPASAPSATTSSTALHQQLRHGVSIGSSSSRRCPALRTSASLLQCFSRLRRSHLPTTGSLPRTRLKLCFKCSAWLAITISSSAGITSSTGTSAAATATSDGVRGISPTLAGSSTPPRLPQTPQVRRWLHTAAAQSFVERDLTRTIALYNSVLLTSLARFCVLDVPKRLTLP